MKFKIGDRVIVKEDNMFLGGRGIKKGMTGTVIGGDCDFICVEFDKNVRGHSCDGKGKYGHCLYCLPCRIEKIVKETESIKITIDEFKKDSRHIAIHCKTKEEIDKIIESMPKLDIPISTNWTGYNNKKGVLIYNSWGEFGGAHWDFPNSHSAQQIYEFEEIDFKKKTKMEELEDITLQKGDRVIFDDGTVIVTSLDYAYARIYKDTITKIERPTRFETIYEAPKDILDKEEKEYLSAVIKPFRKKDLFIEKIYSKISDKEYIYINTTYTSKISDGIMLPYFKKGTMYKGMETDKKYTLEELGL